MFDQPYEFKYKNKRERKEGGKYICIDYVFTFRALDGQVYVVNVEEYNPHHVFVIKFHQKSHQNSKNKYSILTNTHDASRKIATCIEIMLSFYQENPYSSFGFAGANLIGESKENTKRFRVYATVMANFFSPKHFEHYTFEKESCYLMLNRDNSEPDLLDKVEKMFREIYVFEEEDS